MATTTDLPATMKAWHFQNASAGLEKSLKLEDSVPLPKLKANESLIKVHAISLNPVDYKMAELPFPASLALKKPGCPAHDYAGVLVSTTNPALKSLEGKRVLASNHPPHGGACAEYAVAVGEQTVAALPDNVSFDAASCIGIAGLTAWQSVLSIGSEEKVKGARIFVNGGSGGCGIFAVQFAKALGATVTASCSTPNVELVRGMGADTIIDYKQKDIGTALKEEVGGDLEGKGYDLVVDNVGTPTGLYKEADLFLKPSGLFTQVGATPSLATAKSMGDRALRPAFLGGGKRKWKFLGRQDDKVAMERNVQLVSEGKVKVNIGERFSFDKVPEAYTLLKKGSGTGGKIVIDVKS